MIQRAHPQFTGGTAYEEETWKEFTIGNQTFYGVKPSGRCIIVIFGQNVITKNQGNIKVGDEIVLF